MKTNYPLGTIAYCTACGNYVELVSNVEQGEYWALIDARDINTDGAIDINCGCNA